MKNGYIMNNLAVVSLEINERIIKKIIFFLIILWVVNFYAYFYSVLPDFLDSIFVMTAFYLSINLSFNDVNMSCFFENLRDSKKYLYIFSYIF